MCTPVSGQSKLRAPASPAGELHPRARLNRDVRTVRVIASLSSSTSGATLSFDTAADIRGLRFRNPAVDFSVIDDLTLNTGKVPEPTSLLLAGLALAAAGSVRRSRRG